MRYSALGVLLLAISEPLLIHAKVLVVVPVRKTRRSPAPWRSPYKKYYASNYGPHDNRYYNRNPFPTYPSSDDFNQGYESVNHVHLPYGKDLSQTTTFGKPYIPYNVKGGNLPFMHERYAGAYTRQPSYSPTGITPGGHQDYAVAASAHSYGGPNVDSYFSDMDNAARNGGLHDNLKDTSKYYSARSIEKDLSLRNQQALSSVIDKDAIMKSTEAFVKDISPTPYPHVTTSVTGAQGAVILPAGIPSATIGGNKNGIVLRDTVSLDEYQKKLEELTKAWPSVLTDGNFAGATGSPTYHQQLQVGFPTAGLPGSATFAGPTGWFSNFAQPKQGYAVREDHGDSTTHDFRTMPIHAAYQQLPFGNANVGPLPLGAGFASSIHG